MKLSFNIIFQLAAVVVQFGNLASGFTSGKIQAGILLGVSLAQALVSWKAHASNTDGTPQSVGYILDK